uniref:Uncharacterized protein n=1 Tax=Rhizophora mucronata TaxID=61149 RepID=A0A2P2QG72_RHIMU
MSSHHFFLVFFFHVS